MQPYPVNGPNICISGGNSMRTFSLFAVVAFGLTTGCALYDNDCPRNGQDNVQLDEPAPQQDPIFMLTPNVAAPGDVFIASLESDHIINFDSIVNIEFMGEVTICTTQARDEELLITIGVSEDAMDGTIDMLIEFDDGEFAYVESALTVGFHEGSEANGDSGSSGDETSGDDPEDGNSNNSDNGDDDIGGDDDGGICGG